MAKNESGRGGRERETERTKVNFMRNRKSVCECVFVYVCVCVFVGVCVCSKVRNRKWAVSNSKN